MLIVMERVYAFGQFRQLSTLTVSAEPFSSQHQTAVGNTVNSDSRLRSACNAHCRRWEMSSSHGESVIT